VFAHKGGAWRRTAELVPADPDDEFGVSVAVSSDDTTALVGADGGDGPNGGLAGLAYVFAREGGSWRQTAKLAPSDGDPSDIFGTSVAVSGDGSSGLVGGLGRQGSKRGAGGLGVRVRSRGGIGASPAD
jgi:hypothetical protein